MKVLFSEKRMFPICLVCLFFLLLLITVPWGRLYGSTTDWLSQHAALAETIRDACLSQGTLLPGFLPLGGGSNGFCFSYYGYLRPDIFIGCLLPKLPMAPFLILYMLAGYLASVLLGYVFFVRNTGSRKLALFGSILFLTAACFFHTHRQVMFVNYMPFLLAALLAIERGKSRLAALFFVLVCCSSFYYAPAAFLAAGIYWQGVKGRGFFWPWLKTVFLSAGLSAVLLVPSLLVILEHRRALSEASAVPLFLPKAEFLLYSPYGMGLTAVCLYLLLAGLGIKGLRGRSLLFLALCFCGVFAWLLNGTLYARGKILVPFVPLLILHGMQVLKRMHRAHAWYLFPFVPLACCLYAYRGSSRFLPMLAELLTLFLVCVLLRLFHRADNRRPALACSLYCLLLLVPVLSFVRAAESETFVTKEQYEAAEHSFSFAAEPLYRFDSLYEPLSAANRTAEGVPKSSMYSSVTNQAYAAFYYDILQTPIQINNRIALLPEENPFLFQLMGIRYLKTTKEKLPEGYHVLAEDKDCVLAENPNVLPIAYVTEDVLAEEEFEELSDTQRLAALMCATVVEDAADLSSRRTVDFLSDGTSSVVRQTAPVFSKTECTGELQLSPLASGGCDVRAGEDAALTITLKEPLKKDILLLNFQVENKDRTAVVITVNEIKNKLSGKTAPYPNENDCFHYQLSEGGEGLKQLTVTFSPGHYQLTDIQWNLFSKQALTAKQYKQVTAMETTGNEILCCTAESGEDGWFVTSIPLQRGLSIQVDGSKAEVVRVNTAFAGVKLSEGRHRITVSFTPPGLAAGACVSAVFLAGSLISLCVRKRRLRTKRTLYPVCANK